ncbi:MAG: FHA domain-containing protein, partial [Rubrivivax sp.]
MSLKSWVLDRVHRMNAVVSRPDLPARGTGQEPALDAPRDSAPRAARLPRAPSVDGALSSAEHLGAYALLIDAIRDELEHFVASHVRLHLAIADHDRFLLTSIGVRSPDAADARELLQQFMHEFKPEQVKRYLAREVIGALPNAAAIDLSQFAGLFDADARDDADTGGEYRELLAALRSTPMSSALRPYQVNILGRWTELDPARAAGAANAYRGATPTTPLAGQRCELDVEDGDGRRRVVLQAVVPGRRYVVGKREGCDIRVNGTYTSSLHAEIWLDNGAWWVADAGSTNGMRVESPGGVSLRSGPAAA